MFLDNKLFAKKVWTFFQHPVSSFSYNLVTIYCFLYSRRSGNRKVSYQAEIIYNGVFLSKSLWVTVNFCLFEGWGRQKYSFPSPRVSLGGTCSFLSKNLPEHCITNHGVWIKCIFEQLDRISNVVACLPQSTNLPVAERIFYTNNRAGFFCDGSKHFSQLRWRTTCANNCACTRQRALGTKVSTL